LTQDRLLQVTQRTARLEPEFLDQKAPRLPVALERVRLTTGAVERQHQLPAQSLVIGMLRDQRLEPGNDLGVAADRELGLDQILLDGQLKIFESCDLKLREPFEGKLGERWPPPKRKRFAKLLDALDCRCRRPRFSPEPLDTPDIRLLRTYVKDIARRPGQEHLAGGKIAPEGAALLQSDAAIAVACIESLTG
jgi:hypothetical protein